MRKSTSGLFLTEYESGSIRLEVVDYDISEFGGSDLEMWYNINSENAEKLKEQLSKLHSGTLEEMLIAQFGKEFNMREFNKFCAQNGIKYSFDTWRSD